LRSKWPYPSQYITLYTSWHLENHIVKLFHPGKHVTQDLLKRFHFAFKGMQILPQMTVKEKYTYTR
jgi:hypothetical protein